MLAVVFLSVFPIVSTNSWTRGCHCVFGVVFVSVLPVVFVLEHELRILVDLHVLVYAVGLVSVFAFVAVAVPILLVAFFTSRIMKTLNEAQSLGTKSGLQNRVKLCPSRSRSKFGRPNRNYRCGLGQTRRVRSGTYWKHRPWLCRRCATSPSRPAP